MKLTKSEIDEIRGNTHPIVKKLLKFYESVTHNSAYESYVARKLTMLNWDSDLINNPVRLFNKDDDEETAKARDKDVDRVLKYLEKQTDLYEQTEELRNKLTGEEVEAVNKDKRLKAASEDRAFKGMRNGDNQ